MQKYYIKKYAKKAILVVFLLMSLYAMFQSLVSGR